MKINRNSLGNIYLTPDNGYKYLTNGSVFSKEVYVPDETYVANWHDTNDDPPEPEEQISDSESLNIITGGSNE